MANENLSPAEFYDLFVEEGVTHSEAAKALGFKNPNGLSGAICRGDLDIPRYRMGRRTMYLKRDIAAELQRRRIGGSHNATA